MKRSLLLIVFAFIFHNLVLAGPPSEEGKQIFVSRCAACHSVNKTLTGPALAGLHERRSIDWIVKFVQSSQSVIKSGDKDALALYEKFNKIPMPDHSDLSEENIKTIVEFIKSESKDVNTASVAPFAKPGRLKPAHVPISINNYGFFLSYLGLVSLLVGALIALVKVKGLQRGR